MSSNSVQEARKASLTVRDKALEGGRTIMIAVDESEHSRTAFEWFFKNVFRPNDFIVLTHVEEPPNFPSFSLKDGLALPVDEWRKRIEEQITKINKLQGDYEADLIGKRVHYKITGEHNRNIGDAIVREAEKEGANLIVVGTRGLGAVRRTLLGSVSDYVVRHSTVPVIVCPKST
jgi:nucleotide-binding universal stress UspA family protein